MFYSIKELVEQADKDFNGNIAELMISTETELNGRSRDEIIHIMKKNLQKYGWEVVSSWAMGDTLENLSRTGEVEMNLVVSSVVLCA